MTVTVSVDATWRLSRVEFNTMHNMPWDVHGRGEVLLQEASEPAPILGKGTRDGEKVTYGTMPSLPVSRLISDVIAETVEVGGNTISFDTIMQALPLFFEKWRTEDAENPPVGLRRCRRPRQRLRCHRHGPCLMLNIPCLKPRCSSEVKT